MKEKKELIGTVVSNSADKTITVKVETYRKHPLYGKRVKYSKNMLLMMKIISLMLVIKFA